MTFEIRYDNQYGCAVFKVGIGFLYTVFKEDREMIESYMFLGWWRDDHQIN